MSDLIDRQAAIDACRESYEPILDLTSNGHTIADSFEDILNALPSAEPERKTGRWIPVTNGRGGHECDKCHNYAPSYQCGDEYLSDYCPNCGCKMEVEHG